MAGKSKRGVIKAGMCRRNLFAHVTQVTFIIPGQFLNNTANIPDTKFQRLETDGK